jgi:hypothetical protein
MVRRGTAVTASNHARGRAGEKGAPGAEVWR